MQTIPLHMLKVGERATVLDLIGQPEDVHRLEEMGLRAGQPIVMLVPGQSCVVRLGEHRLALRPDPATSILVCLES
jgi:Fe2+ transport system protein FeoA